MGLFTSILGAVAGPIAGLFKKKEKPQVTENRVNYKQMVADAEAAGFNPLTVLRNGGSAGYGTSVQHPALSSSWGERFADTIATGVSAWANFDPMAEARSNLEYQLVEEQLKTAKRQGSRSFDVPTYRGGTVRTSPGGFVASNAGPSAYASSSPGYQSSNNIWAGSVFDPWIQQMPGWPSASKVEDEYSDIVGNAYGVAKVLADTSASAKAELGRNKNMQKARKELNDILDKDVRPVTDRGANAFAKAYLQQLQHEPRYYTPDMRTLRFGAASSW